MFSRIGPLNVPISGDEEEESDVIQTVGSASIAPIAATSNYEHIVLRGAGPEDYWPFDETQGSAGSNSIYEYSGTGNNQPLLVGVEGGKGSTALIGLCGTTLGSGQGGSEYNALSNDGETIYVTVLPKEAGGCEAAGPPSTEIYARLHGGLISPEAAASIDVSANECTKTCGEESGKNFEGASESGAQVFFTSTQKLTDDATDATASGNATVKKGCAAVAEGEGGCNLYEYDFDIPGAECQEHHRCLRLVAGGAEVVGVSGIAENGGYVYFVARGVIGSAEKNELGNGPEEHQPNLYAYDAEDDTTAFITTLSEEDGRDWVREFRRPIEVSGLYGEFLLFASSREGITPDDKTTATQLFEYDAATKELVRVTQGEGGFNENGNGAAIGVGRESIENVAEQLGFNSDFKTTDNVLNISGDGKTVAFKTRGQLSPLASSATAPEACESVYEFHTSGPISEGSIHLVSDGRDAEPSSGQCGAGFQGMDESGNNILFSTDDALLPSDIDNGQRDIYDARVGGGFMPSAGAGSCLVEGCEAPGAAMPALPGVPGSLTQAPEASASGGAAPTTADKKVKPATATAKSAKLSQALKALPEKTRKPAIKV